ncbi:MAG TPA: universal stress protein [Acetobacteraceae bacterium]|nr:universal stress protein [Acetobacteraceae bacterium]
MALKDILVHLDGSKPAEGRLRLAANLARQHGAHLAVLHVVDIEVPLLASADAGGGVAIAGVIEQMRNQALTEAARLEAMARERMRLEGLSGEWRQAEGLTAEQVALHARYADLVVIGQDDPDGSTPNAAAVVEQVLFSSGRPALIVPYAGQYESVGQRVLVGWKPGREAARAVNDALPLLAAAESVTVFSVNPRGGIGGHGEQPGADMALHLARHGIKVRVEHSVAPGAADADIILNQAADMGADLLVVGAYGHSRIREMVMGGVTRTLLRQMTVPVLMSH